MGRMRAVEMVLESHCGDCKLVFWDLSLTCHFCLFVFAHFVPINLAFVSEISRIGNKKEKKKRLQIETSVCFTKFREEIPSGLFRKSY